MRSIWSRWSKHVPLWFLSSLVDACFAQLWSMPLLMFWRDQPWRAALPSLLWLTLVGCLGNYVVWRYGRHKQVQRSTQLTWGLALLALGYWLAYAGWVRAGGSGHWLDANPALVTVAATLWVWLMQTSRSDRSASGTMELRGRYGYSLGVYLVIVLFQGMTGVPGVVGQTGLLMVTGLVATLLEFGLLTHQENLERLQRTGEQGVNQPFWALPAAVVVGGMAIGLGEIVSDAPLSPLGALVRNVLWVIFYPVAWLGGLLAELLGTALRRVAGADAGKLLLEQQARRLPKPPDVPPPLPLGSSPQWLHWLLVLLVVGAVVGIILLVRARYEGPEGDQAEERESLGFLAHAWRDLRRTAQKAVRADLPPARTAAGRLYRRLQRWAAGHGLPRQPGETPAQHAARLAAAHPDAADAARTVAGVYQQERYSQAVPDAPQVESATAAIERLEAVKPPPE